MSVSIPEIVIRLITSCLLSGLIGLEREIKDKPAGLRTHILVGVGAAIFTIASVSFTGPRSDPTRIASGIVAGIGFLGAGTIMRSGNITLGLTTAASLWTASGIGLAIGAGLYWLGGLTTALVLIVLVLFRKFEKRFVRALHHGYLLLKIVDQPGQLGKIGTRLGELGVDIKHVELRLSEEQGEVWLELGVKLPPELQGETLPEKLIALEGVKSASWS